jgi:sec-independent protein translocase protein TatA
MFRNPYADGLIVLVVILLFFGPKRLPTLGRSLGQGMREFKDSITGASRDDEADQRPEIAQASATAPVVPPAAAPEREASEAASREPRS